MKKRIFIAVPYILTLCILSGCACQHEWADADCVNPQICTKCNETAGEALGHDWAAATCTAPETCSRCGETQGAALDHAFDSWSINGEEMTHTCENCGLEETTELDPGVYLEVLLQGHWEITAMVNTQEQEYYSINAFPEIAGEYLQFSKGNTLTGILNGEKFTGTWEFHQRDTTDGNDIYVFLAVDESGRDLEMHLTCTDKKIFLSVFYANGVRVLMENYAEFCSKFIGDWYSEKDDTSYMLSFRDDHTVTCVLDEEFEGTWHLMPIQDIGSISYYGLHIIREENGERSIIEGAILLSNPSAPPYGISLHWNKDNLPGLTTGFRKR